MDGEKGFDLSQGLWNDNGWKEVRVLSSSTVSSCSAAQADHPLLQALTCVCTTYASPMPELA